MNNTKRTTERVSKLLLFTFLFLIFLPFSYSLDITTDESKYSANEGVNIFLDPILNATYANYTTYWGDHPSSDYDLLVPYTGATDDVDLGNNDLTSDNGYFDKVGVGTTMFDVGVVFEVNTGNGKFNNNLTVGGYYFGDGSQLTGLPECIWTNESGTATYQGDTLINGSLTVGNMELSGNDGETELSYTGQLLQGDSSSVFDIRLNTTLFPGYPFNFKAYIDSSASSTTGVLVQKGSIGTYADISPPQVVEGIRFIFDDESISQSQGTRSYKGVNNEFVSIIQSGGQQNSYGVYSKFNNPSLGGGSGTTNLYGSYNEFTQGVSFTGSPELNEYGFYSKSVDDVYLAGVVNRYGLYLEGYDEGSFEDEVYAIFVDDGDSQFGGDVNIDGDLQADDYYSGDGTQGFTGTCGYRFNIIVKDGLIVGCN